MSTAAIVILGLLGSVGLIAGLYYVICKVNGTWDKKPGSRHDKYDQF